MLTLEAQAEQLPQRPGVYLFQGAKGETLYVGKARRLRERVQQYLAGHDTRTMVPVLVSLTRRIDIAVTDTEKEALLLENTLIKLHKPRYNVLLKDDSSYLYLSIRPQSAWPRFTIARKRKNKKAVYFGPYTSASKARKSLSFLQRVYPLRTCTDQVLRNRKRPCLLHQMGRCVAPCTEEISKTHYNNLIKEAMALLEGKRESVVGQLTDKMLAHSEAMEFEQAANVRDVIESLRATIERQKVVAKRSIDQDIWGIHLVDGLGAISVVPYREGIMQQPINGVFQYVEDAPDETLSSLMNQYYQHQTLIPPRVLVPLDLTDQDALQEVLSERRGTRCVLTRPQRGMPARLMKLAKTNAQVHFQSQRNNDLQMEEALSELAQALDLDGPPERIECFDNSHIQGHHAVAAMAVFVQGAPSKKDYRRYRLKSGSGADDYASMREVLTRRIRRGLQEDNLPDLLVVDGGKGQLSAAIRVLNDLGVHQLAVACISKSKAERARGGDGATDRIFLPGVEEHAPLPRGSRGLRILQHIRDESHRHAVQYHRKVRNRRTLTSALEGIPGIGPKRRNALLQHLGSVDRVLAADIDALAKVPGVGPKTAITLHRLLHEA